MWSPLVWVQATLQEAIGGTLASNSKSQQDPGPQRVHRPEKPISRSR